MVHCQEICGGYTRLSQIPLRIFYSKRFYFLWNLQFLKGNCKRHGFVNTMGCLCEYSEYSIRIFNRWLASSVQWSWLFQRFCKAHTTVAKGKSVTNELKKELYMKRDDELFVLECLHCCEHKESKAVGRRHHLRIINSLRQYMQWCAAVACCSRSKFGHNQKILWKEHVSWKLRLWKLWY